MAIRKIFPIYEIYEQIFTIHQADRSIQDYFMSLHALMDELEIYQPFVADISKIRGYYDELSVAAFMFGLKPELGSQITNTGIDSWC